MGHNTQNLHPTTSLLVLKVLLSQFETFRVLFFFLCLSGEAHALLHKSVENADFFNRADTVLESIGVGASCRTVDHFYTRNGVTTSFGQLFNIKSHLVLLEFLKLIEPWHDASWNQNNKNEDSDGHKYSKVKHELVSHGVDYPDDSKVHDWREEQIQGNTLRLVDEPLIQSLVVETMSFFDLELSEDSKWPLNKHFHHHYEDHKEH